jgi:hypothetical protein
VLGSSSIYGRDIHRNGGDRRGMEYRRPYGNPKEVVRDVHGQRR